MIDHFDDDPQDVSALSTEQKGLEEEEERLNTEIAATNSAIYLISEHAYGKNRRRPDPRPPFLFPYAPDDGSVLLSLVQRMD